MSVCTRRVPGTQFDQSPVFGALNRKASSYAETVNGDLLSIVLRG